MSLKQTRKHSVTVTRRRGGSGRSFGSADLSAAARVRATGEDFTASFLQLQDAVRDACTREGEWEARVVAGIRATLEFVAENPARAEALTVRARRSRPPRRDRDPEREVLGYFAGLLGAVAPAERRFPISTDEAIVESIATIVRGHLLGGTADQLPGIAPDLVYLALMPYLGLAETQRWVAASAEDH
jgi:hypothetical protein